MWGPYIFAGAAGSSMSLLVLVTTALRKAGYLKVLGGPAAVITDYGYNIDAAVDNDRRLPVRLRRNGASGF
jgi:hypothetical protein